MVSTFMVRSGRRYQASISLGLLEQFADNEMIAARLRTVGFDDVKVVGAGATRRAEGVWLGPDTSAALPEQITSVVEI